MLDPTGFVQQAAEQMTHRSSGVGIAGNGSRLLISGLPPLGSWESSRRVREDATHLARERRHQVSWKNGLSRRPKGDHGSYVRGSIKRRRPTNRYQENAPLWSRTQEGRITSS